MESKESNEAGFPLFPHSLEIPSGFPHSHGFDVEIRCFEATAKDLALNPGETFEFVATIRRVRTVAIVQRMRSARTSTPPQLDTEPGASVYSPTILKVYDLCVNGLSHRFVWQCPTKTVLLPFYKEHLGLKHLDVGVGTGFFIARAGLTSSHQVGLLDLNENCLRAAAAQVKQAKVRTFRRDLMQPSSEPADTGYDSISLFHVLHCLPGTMEDKETAIANLKRYLSKTGVLYGVTILGEEAGHNRMGRMLLKIYNDKGIMHNLGDTLDDLQRMLRRQFQNVQVRRHNKVALFVARD